MTSGGLVSDDIVLAILKDRLSEPDTAQGVILDGFPRTTVQARALDELLAQTGQRINSVISLDVDDGEMVLRVAGRFTCGGCGEGYHDTYKQPAVADVCDKCGSTKMQRRADDNATAMRERLAAYHAQTAPLISYYEEQGTLQRIDAMGEIAQIAEDLSAIVKKAVV